MLPAPQPNPIQQVADLEHTLKEERPPVARRGLRLLADLLGGGNEQLLQLLQQAFDGQMPGRQVNASRGGQGGQAAAAAAEDEVGAARSHSRNSFALAG